jgi:Effector Associated Constant Component 1
MPKQEPSAKDDHMLVTVTSSDDASLYSLARWLESDDTVGGRVTMGSSGTRPGAQSPLDVVNVILSNSTALGSLLIAYASWRRSKAHEQTPKVTFQRGDVTVTVEDAEDETIQKLIGALSGDDDPRP